MGGDGDGETVVRVVEEGGIGGEGGEEGGKIGEVGEGEK